MRQEIVLLAEAEHSSIFLDQEQAWHVVEVVGDLFYFHDALLHSFQVSFEILFEFVKEPTRTLELVFNLDFSQILDMLNKQGHRILDVLHLLFVVGVFHLQVLVIELVVDSLVREAPFDFFALQQLVSLCLWLLYELSFEALKAQLEELLSALFSFCQVFTSNELEETVFPLHFLRLELSQILMELVNDVVLQLVPCDDASHPVERSKQLRTVGD